MGFCLGLFLVRIRFTGTNYKCPFRILLLLPVIPLVLVPLPAKTSFPSTPYNLARSRQQLTKKSQALTPYMPT